MDWGAAARKRTAQTTSKNMTAITQLPHRFLEATEPSTKKPSQASARNVRNKIRREALDSWGSFREGMRIEEIARAQPAHRSIAIRAGSRASLFRRHVEA